MNTTTKKLLRQTNLIVGGIITLSVIIVAVFASFLAPYHPFDDADLMVSEEPPSAVFWFGTDNQGRDVLSRVIYGARISLAVGLISQAFNTIIGVALGLSAGFFGKWWDDFVVALTNVMLSIPSLIFALAVMALLGPGLLNVFVALGFTNWSYTCRITRSQALSARTLDYVTAARALGYGRTRIMFTQILPNIIGPILVIATWVLPGPSCWKLLSPSSVWACSRRLLPGAPCFQPPGSSSSRHPGSVFSRGSPSLSPSWGSIFWETVCGIFSIPIRSARRKNKVYSSQLNPDN